jgi:hypothetical protein
MHYPLVELLPVIPKRIVVDLGQIIGRRLAQRMERIQAALASASQHPDAELAQVQHGLGIEQPGLWVDSFKPLRLLLRDVPVAHLEAGRLARAELAAADEDVAAFSGALVRPFGDEDDVAAGEHTAALGAVGAGFTGAAAVGAADAEVDGQAAAGVALGLGGGSGVDALADLQPGRGRAQGFHARAVGVADGFGRLHRPAWPAPLRRELLPHFHPSEIRREAS